MTVPDHLISSNLKCIKCIMVLILIPAIMHAQSSDDDDKKKDKDPIELKYGLETGYSFGLHLRKESTLFETNFQVHTAIDYKAASRIYYGIGAGYEKYDTESFLPLYITFKGFTDKKYEGPYLSFIMGYSLAWDSEFNSYDNYHFRGGLLYGTGIGRSLRSKINTIFC